MAQEIVDLISDDEDIELPESSKGAAKVHSSVRTSSTSIPQTINPALLVRRTSSQIPFDTPNSTPSSHTERNSPTRRPTVPDSPLFFPSPSLAPKDINKDKGKGKGRASPIPEIDLSQDSDGGNTPAGVGAVDETWDYANGEFTEEDALKQAIALSLQDTTPQHAANNSSRAPAGPQAAAVQKISSPSAQSGDLKPLPDWHTSPIKPRESFSSIPQPSSTSNPVAPLVTVQGAADTLANEKNASEKNTGAIEPKPAASFSLAGLNRQQMEAERIARMKRKHESTQDEQENQEGPVSKAAKITTGQVARDKTVSPPPLRQPVRRKSGNEAGAQFPQLPTRVPANTAENHNPQPHALSETISLEDDDNDIPAPKIYPEGIALKTYIAGFPKTQTISFPDLISPSPNLDSVLLSSFIWDFDWLLPHFDTRRTKFQLVMHAKSDAERESIKQEFQGVPNVRLTMPPMDGNVNCMHSKLMLLFFKDEEGTKWKDGQRCKIVIPTANLVGFDWGVGDFMENTVWLIDLPLKDSSAKNVETPFQKSLKLFLRAQTVPDDVLQKLDAFDFRRTAQFGFVHTIGGMHSGHAWMQTGLCGLGRTVTELGLATKTYIQLDYVTSSVGSLNDDFMSSMYLAAQGDSGLTAYTRRVKKTPGSRQSDMWKERFRLYYPSDNTVRASKGGARRAGTICFQTRWWEGLNFPRSNMLDCVSVRKDLLMHNKLLFVRCSSQSEATPSSKLGWAYVGSANLSESAWGRLVQDKTSREPRLNCRNWECGVIIPITAKSSQATSITGHVGTDLTSFTDHVPMPMRLPGDSMGAKKPWTSFDNTSGS